MSASILDYSINFATSFIRKEILNGEAVYQVWSSVRDIGNLLVILFLGIIAVSLISGIFGQITKKSVVWVLGAALLINFSGVITTLVYTSGTVISKGFLDKSKGLVIGDDTSCKKGVAKCISAAVSITSLNESLYESELFKTLEAAKSDHKKRANDYYEKLAKEGKYNSNQISQFKDFTFGELKKDFTSWHPREDQGGSMVILSTQPIRSLMKKQQQVSLIVKTKQKEKDLLLG